MPSPTICTVSGTVNDPSGTAVSAAIIKATLSRPFTHSADSSLILPFEVSTTSASDGTWSLALVETTTDSAYMSISFVFPIASANANIRRDYSVIIPNAATATFASLTTGQ